MKVLNVTAAIIIYKNKILSVRRAKGKHLAGYWEFPGGKVEDNEQLEDCLGRELQEELEINAAIGDYVGQSTHDYGDRIIRLHAFMVPVESESITLIDHDKSRWLSYDELDDVKWAPADIPLVNQLKTYLFYKNNVEQYVNETLDINITDSIQRFIEHLPKESKILDIGCGSGRDSLCFKQQGFSVVATDSVSEMAISASKNISQEVLVRSFFNLGINDIFDGVWASASLLHCPKSEMTSALQNITNALKTNGIAYISLKQGEGECLDKFDRYFSYYSEQEVAELIDQIEGLTIEKLWLDESTLRGSHQVWINLLLTKGVADDR